MSALVHSAVLGPQEEGALATPCRRTAAVGVLANQ